MLLIGAAPENAFPAGTAGMSRPEPDAEKFNRVACLRGYRGIAQGTPGRAEDIVGIDSFSVRSRTVRPENNSGHMCHVKQGERRRELTQSHGRSGAAGGGGYDYGYRTSRRVVRRLQVDLPGTDKQEIRRFTIDLHAGATQRLGKIAIPEGGFAGEIVPVNRYQFAWLDDVCRAEKRNDATGRNGRGLRLARVGIFRRNPAWPLPA